MTAREPRCWTCWGLRKCRPRARTCRWCLGDPPIAFTRAERATARRREGHKARGTVWAPPAASKVRVRRDG